MSTALRDQRKIKCIAWDLDDTVWNGTLLENDELTLREGVRETIATLDRRGILHSVASRNDHDMAMARLEKLGLAHFFLSPQIGWGPKSDSVRRIAEAINIGIDTVAFVDDQPYEREEVSFAHPEILCIDAREVPSLPSMPEMNPHFITPDSGKRRQMYLSEEQRKQEEGRFSGPKEAFLETLGMKMIIGPAEAGDLARAEELTVRTNQLNTTAYTYSYEELDHLRESPDHLILMASLDDRFGTYGKIGLAVIEKAPGSWTIKLLLMSCRVMARGVGNVLISHIRRLARDAGVRLLAEFIPNDRNRMMYMTYRFSQFEEVGKEGDIVLMASDLSQVPPLPDYVSLRVVEPDPSAREG